MASLRSEAVKSSFDPSLMGGLWYEHRYIDPAQAFASCQTLNTTIGEEGGSKTLVVDFSVRYGAVPFTIREIYTPTEPPVKGIFKKNVDKPGGSLLTLPTAVVAALPHPSGGRQYVAAALYSCLDVSLLGRRVDEVVFMTRSPNPDAAALAELQRVAEKVGVPFSPADLRQVDHSACSAHAVGGSQEEGLQRQGGAYITV